MDRLTLTFLRIGQAVRALALEEAHAIGLTPAQAQTLLFINGTKSFATTVRQLAATLGSTHASTVGVIDGLAAKGLVTRAPGERDRRQTLLRLTPAGKELCGRLAGWGGQLGAALAGQPPAEREALERGLGAVVWSLRAAGHLTVAEPCRGCVHFAEEAAPGAPEPHYCRLLKAHLSEREAAKDCPEHEPLAGPDAADPPAGP
ncbi:MAG TPA: MarR family transcriptional regulator [Herpetosiphonaceae bacterium]